MFCLYSVVTSVSVIMDTGNGSKAVFTDAVGKPVPKPSTAAELASPIDLLNPDRYEFYTFDDNGDLIKRLMSLEEIQGIIATGDSDGYDLDSFTSLGYLPEKRVNDVVNNVQNVLKEEMETHKTPPDPKPIFDTPDVSDSWSMILPAVFGNSGEDIKPERPIAHVTPDTIMVEPNMHNVYLSTSTSQKINTVTTSSGIVTSASTPRSTSYSEAPSKTPTVFSTTVQMSTTDKLMTLKPESITNIIPALTSVTEEKMKPVINVEIYSNSKSTTEKPLDQLGIENSPIIEIKPNSITDTPKISSEPKITTKMPSTTVKAEIPSQSTTQPETKLPSTATEIVTKQTPTLLTFIPSSMGSTLPTTKTPAKTTTQQPKTESTTPSTTQPVTTPDIPVLTKHTTEGLSTWRPELFSTTETQTLTEEVPLSTWEPKITTERLQSSSNVDDLPTFADLLNLYKDAEAKPSTLITTTVLPEIVENVATTLPIINDNKMKEEPTTTESLFEEKVQSTERYVPEDLSTLGSEVLTTTVNESSDSQNQNRLSEHTTQLPPQSINNDQKASATDLLDQLLITTNIFEINTELAEKTTEQQIFNNDEDERFEANAQEETKLSEVKTESPIATTEQFLIKITEQNEEPTTDKTLIDSIGQLLSQAVGNVEETLAAINDTQTIQNMLSNSSRKNMSEVQTQSATFASSLVDSNNNLQEEDEKTTTERSMLDAITSGESDILSDSVDSLLSQVYENNLPVVMTNTDVLPTEKYPAPTTISNIRNDDDIVYSTLASDKWESISANNNQDINNNGVTFALPETTTVTSDEIINESTTITYVPVATINKNNTDSESQGNDFLPHLINITIVSSENTDTNIRNSSYKPAKLDISLEQFLDEIKKNVTLAESTEMYIEQTSSGIEKSGDKTPNEILTAEESMAALHDSDLTTTTMQPVTEIRTDLPEVQVTTELSTEAPELTTTEPLPPIKETIFVEKKPTTVVIIKKTEKPLTELYTTMAIKTNDNIETTTVLDEKLLESTTYSKLYPEITEGSLTTILDLIQEDSNTERVTEKITDIEPSVEIVITENNKNLSEGNKPENSTYQTLTNDSTKIKTESNKYKTSKPQVINNVRITIQTLKKEDSNYTIRQQEHKPSEFEKTKDNPESTWTLVPTVAPHGEEPAIENEPSSLGQYPEIIDTPAPIDLEPKPLQGFGLEDSTSRLDTDIYQFAQLCNELAFGFWKTVTNGLSSARSVFVSPFGATSLLAMVFLGARGATSGEMNEILRLDDMVTFNPHLIFKNVSESIKADETDSGVASSAIIRELFSDRSKGKLLPFYKERAKAFYDGFVEEVSFREIGDVIRRRTNLQVKKYTNGKTSEFLRDSSINARSPLAGVSVNIFQVRLQSKHYTLNFRLKMCKISILGILLKLHHNLFKNINYICLI